MYFTSFLTASLGISTVFAATNYRERAAKYERRSASVVPRVNTNVEKRETSSNYLTPKTKRENTKA